MKLIRWTCILAVAATILAVYWAFTGGGERFRWLGQKTEETGKAVREGLDEAAEKADKVHDVTKETSEKAKDLKKNLEKNLEKKLP